MSSTSHGHLIRFPGSITDPSDILASSQSLGRSYFGWVEEVNDNLMMISLKIVDGNRIWDGILGVENKPHSRRHETNREYFDLLKDSLINISKEKYEYAFQQSPASSVSTTSSSSFDPSHDINSGGILTFIIKERMEGMSALVARYDYLLYSHNSHEALTSFYNSVHSLLATKDDHIACLKNEIQANRLALDTLCQQNIEFTKNKETFQRDFFTKFCLIINSKKDEVKRLCGEIGHYKEQMEALKAQLTSLQEQNLLRTSLQLRSEDEILSTSREVNPKPKPKKAPSKKRVAPRYTKSPASQTQSSEAKSSYLSEDEEEEFEDEDHLSLGDGNGNGGNENEVNDSFGVLSSQLRGRGYRQAAAAAAERRRETEATGLIDPSQSSSQILPPRGVEVGGNQDLDKILSESQQQPLTGGSPDIVRASQTSNSRHSGEGTEIPAVKSEERESARRRPATRSSSQQQLNPYGSTQLEMTSQLHDPHSGASISAAPPQSSLSQATVSRKQKTRVRQMFGSSSEDEPEEGKQQERPKKQLRTGAGGGTGTGRVGGDDDVLNYM
jgi:hypothetical protein